MAVNENDLMRMAVARTAAGDILQGVGQIVAYCDAPMVAIRRLDGTQMWWRADLCKTLPLDEDVVKEIMGTVSD